jgi:hypothetical protein
MRRVSTVGGPETAASDTVMTDPDNDSNGAAAAAHGPPTQTTTTRRRPTPSGKGLHRPAKRPGGVKSRTGAGAGADAGAGAGADSIAHSNAATLGLGGAASGTTGHSGTGAGAGAAARSSGAKRSTNSRARKKKTKQVHGMFLRIAFIILRCIRSFKLCLASRRGLSFGGNSGTSMCPTRLSTSVAVRSGTILSTNAVVCCSTSPSTGAPSTTHRRFSHGMRCSGIIQVHCVEYA